MSDFSGKCNDSKREVWNRNQNTTETESYIREHSLFEELKLVIKHR